MVSTYNSDHLKLIGGCLNNRRWMFRYPHKHTSGYCGRLAILVSADMDSRIHDDVSWYVVLILAFEAVATCRTSDAKTAMEVLSMGSITRDIIGRVDERALQPGCAW